MIRKLIPEFYINFDISGFVGDFLDAFDMVLEQIRGEVNGFEPNVYDMVFSHESFGFDEKLREEFAFFGWFSRKVAGTRAGVDFMLSGATKFGEIARYLYKQRFESFPTAGNVYCGAVRCGKPLSGDFGTSIYDVMVSKFFYYYPLSGGEKVYELDDEIIKVFSKFIDRITPYYTFFFLSITDVTALLESVFKLDDTVLLDYRIDTASWLSVSELFMVNGALMEVITSYLDNLVRIGNLFLESSGISDVISSVIDRFARMIESQFISEVQTLALTKVYYNSAVIGEGFSWVKS